MSFSGPQEVPSSTTPVNSTPSTQDATTASGSVQSNATSGQLDTKTKIGNMNDLREKAPQVFQKMCETIGWTICGSMRRHQDQIKKLLREGQ